MSDKAASADTSPVWDRLEELSDGDFALLVESAVFVLNQAGDVPGPSPAEMPANLVEQSLGAELAKHGRDAADARRIVHEDALSRPVALLTLRQIELQTALGDEIERVWCERRKMMVVVEAGVILSAALLLLVLKLKRVRIDRDKGVDVEFDKLSKDVVSNVFRFLGP